MLGRILNTLNYRLKSELREWRKKNSRFKDYAWSWPQKILMVASARPVQSLSAISLFSIFISALIYIYHTISVFLSVSYTPNLGGSGQTFFALWTVQATIAAFIYPIVIGFVSLLLQRRHSAKASLHIYLHESAAIITGLSGLFLVILMGIQFIFIDVVYENVTKSWLVFDTIWFLANILGVIWFLSHTFEYLMPSRRSKIIRSYAINHILPAELSKNLKNHFFTAAVQYKWVPGPNYGDKEEKSGTATLLGPIGRDMGVIQVKGPSKDEMIVGDVRFRLLSIAIRNWKRREKKLALSSKEKPEPIFGWSEVPLFILPFGPGDSFDANVGLCRTEGGAELKWWERNLIRRSFTLIPSSSDSSFLTINEILSDLVVELQIYLQAGEKVAFREALHELVDLHVDLIQTCSFVNGLGEQDNYSNLVDSGHAFYGDQMHQLWTSEYRPLIEASVDRLYLSEVHFNHLIYVPGWIISRINDVRPITIQIHILNLSRFLHFRLNRWWAKSAEEQGFRNHNACEPCTLKEPLFSIYDSAIKQFIGAWESLKNYRFPKINDAQLNWNDLDDYKELYVSHLNDTIYMMFHNISLGNTEGSEWLCDSLIKWWSTTRLDIDHSHFFIKDKRLLTLELLKTPWGEAINHIDLSIGVGRESDAHKALWSACVHNYWIDMCIVSICAIIQFGKNCICENSLPARLISALTQGNALRSGAERISGRWSIRSIEDLLIAIIRQNYCDGGYRKGYRARIDSVVEGISNQGKPSMVPNRIYTGMGLSDLDAIRDGQLLLLCLVVKKEWLPSQRITKMIKEWGSLNDHNLRSFVRMVEQWVERFGEESFQNYLSLFLCIKQATDETNHLQKAISLILNGFKQLLSTIEDFRLEQLRDAKVSSERLKKIASFCSRTGFKKDTVEVPVSLFRYIQYSSKKYFEDSLTIKNMDKGEFVEPEMAQRASNEAEWFDDIVKNHVAGSVMATIIKELKPTIVDADNPSLYLDHVNFAADIILQNGGTPILLVAGHYDPRWLMDWERGAYNQKESLPKEYRFTHDRQIKDKGYIGSLNDIPLYKSPIPLGSSYLISRELFNKVSFTEFNEDVFVDVTWQKIEGKDNQINLKVIWYFQIDLTGKNCWQLRYNRKRNE